MIDYSVYLKGGFIPTKMTSVICNNCSHTINAGPIYKPKFCDMCGAPISDNLDKIKWEYEDTDWLSYVSYLVEEYPDYLIVKIKYDRTEWGLIGLPPDVEHIPVIIGKNMEDILHFVNERGSREYFEDDFEPATVSELIAYAKTCGQFWKG